MIATFCAIFSAGMAGLAIAYVCIAQPLDRRLRRAAERIALVREHLQCATTEAGVTAAILAEWPEDWTAPLRAAKRLEFVRRALADASAALNEPKRRDPCHESENPGS